VIFELRLQDSCLLYIYDLWIMSKGDSVVIGQWEQCTIMGQYTALSLGTISKGEQRNGSGRETNRE
jgi:hypothetical protein